MLRPNPLKSGLAAGRVQIGTQINLIRNPAVLPLLQSAGLDFARIDMEHSSPSIESVAAMALLARALGFPIMVRPPSGNREWVTRLLDVGVWGLYIPQVDSVEIAESVVQLARYQPLGMRGMAVNSPHNDFSPETPLEAIDEQVHITVMLESARAFEDLDAIVSTPGIDAIALGPTDLAQDLGLLGKAEQAEVIDHHRDLLIAAALRHGKDVSMVCPNAQDARRWTSAGVKLIAIASDVAVLQRSYAAEVRQLRE